MRICGFRDKEVINIKDGKILGFVEDVEFNECNGCILALVVPENAKICGLFGREWEYVIPFKCVCNIGKDVVLVEVELDQVRKKII